MEQLIGECLLKDEEFMKDYVVSHTIQTVRDARCVGTIRNSSQSVLIRKQKFQVALLSRFKALYRLFRQGAILADNMFVKKEADGYYFYVIEAYLAPKKQSKFVSLHAMIQEGKSQEKMKAIGEKIRALLQACHHEGQNYLCLTPQRIIVEQEPEFNVQLAPYELDQASFLESLRAETDLQSNAYLAPEIFDQVLLAGQGRLQVNKKDLIAADFWSFGCILLEMFVLASPAFLSVGLVQQKKRFKQLTGGGVIKAWTTDLDPTIKNLVCNCLESRENRSMNTFLPIPVTKKRVPLVPSNEISLQNSRQELALSAIAEKCQESSLSLSLLALLDHQIQEELKIVVHLFTKFTYYADKSHSQKGRILRLDKIINVDNSFEQFSRLLLKPVQIDFEDGQWRGTAQINLGMLVLRQDSKRVWRKPIVGSYPISNGDSKIRISCILTSPADPQHEPLKISNHEQIEELMNRSGSPSRVMKSSIPSPSPARLLQNPSPPPKDKPKSSILAISEQLSNLTMLWRNKESESDSQSRNSRDRLLRL